MLFRSKPADRARPAKAELEPIIALLRGQVRLQVHCYEVHDIETIVRLADEFHFQIAALHHALEAWKVPRIEPKKLDEIDPYALMVLSAVLSGHDNSRLNRELVRSKRLANEAGSSYDSISRGPELFVIGATAAKGQTTTDLEKGILQSLQDIAEKGITDSELKRIKAQLLASQIYKRDSIFAQAMEIGGRSEEHTSELQSH